MVAIVFSVGVIGFPVETGVSEGPGGETGDLEGSSFGTVPAKKNKQTNKPRSLVKIILSPSSVASSGQAQRVTHTSPTPNANLHSLNKLSTNTPPDICQTLRQIQETQHEQDVSPSFRIARPLDKGLQIQPQKFTASKPHSLKQASWKDREGRGRQNMEHKAV